MAGQEKKRSPLSENEGVDSAWDHERGKQEMKAKVTVLLVVLGVLMLSSCCFAEPTSGTCGAGVTWTFSDGKLTITGGGAMADYTAGNGAPWKNLGVQTIEIGANITSIGAHAFDACSGMTVVILPESLTSVKASAFSGCTSLESIALPDSVTEIGNSAFGNCTALSRITLSESLELIGDYAFSACTSLTSIYIPDSVTVIKGHAFAGSGLQSIRMSDNIDTMGTSVFENCGQLKEITWPASMRRLPLDSFSGSSVSSVVLQEGVSIIEDRAFQWCGQLTEIHLPLSLTSVKESAFQDCAKLTDVYYAGTKDEKNNINIKMYNDNLQSAAWHYGASGECAIGIHHLVNGVCRSCHRSFDISGMTVVQLPEDLTALEAEALRGIGAQVVIVPAGCTEIGSRAFADCPDLQYVLLPEGVVLATDALSGTEAELLYQ